MMKIWLVCCINMLFLQNLKLLCIQGSHLLPYSLNNPARVGKRPYVLFLGQLSHSITMKIANFNGPLFIGFPKMIIIKSSISKITSISSITQCYQIITFNGQMIFLSFTSDFYT